MKKSIHTALILAAGRGSRLGDLNEDLPKGFLNVGGERLIERSIRLLRACGINRIIVGTGFRSEVYNEMAKRLQFEVFVNTEFSSSESYYTLFLAKDLINEDFLLLESDLLYEPRALTAIIESEHSNAFLCSGFTQSNDEVFLHVNEADEVNFMSQEPKEKEGSVGELVGITKLSAEYFNHIIENSSLDDKLKKIKYEFALLQYQSTDKIKIEKVDDLVWCEIDDEAHLKRANDLILPKLTSV